LRATAPVGDPRLDYEAANAARGTEALDRRIAMLDGIKRSYGGLSRVVATALWMKCDALGDGKDEHRALAEAACDEAYDRFFHGNDRLGMARISAIRARIMSYAAAREGPESASKRLQEAAKYAQL